MKSTLLLVPIVALAFASCSSPNNTTVNNSTVNDTTVVNNNAAAPTIKRFSPDTVWTLQLLTIYGTHFGYDPADVNVTIGGVKAGVAAANDTVLTIAVPDSAQSGFIRLATINGSCTSATPVLVNHTFNPHSIDGDTAFDGASFTIPGGGLKNYHGFIVLRVGGVAFPIDSLFDNKIVSHVIPGASTAEVIVSEAAGTYDCGELYIARPTIWNTLSEIWDNWRVREIHHRTGFINGPTVLIDSLWTDTITYSRQNDVKISGIPFVRFGEWIQYHLFASSLYMPYFQMTWDTLTQSANITFQVVQGLSLPSRTISLDTSWYNTAEGETFSVPLPVDRNIELTFPNNMSYQITEDSSDEAGLVDWHETTSATVLSGNFDLIFKQ